MAYIYAHYIPGKDKPFYIGKGVKKRAWSKWGRTQHWHNIVNKYGFEIKILIDNLTEQDAFEKEKQIIAEYGLHTLVNVYEGGEGMTSAEASRHWKKLYESPEFCEKIRQARINSEKWRRSVQFTGDKLRELTKTKEWQDWNTEKNRRIAKDPTWRKNFEEGRKKTMANPEWRKNRALAVERLKNDPEWRKKNSDRMKQRWENPEYRKQMSENTKKQWAIKKALNKNPNSDKFFN